MIVGADSISALPMATLPGIGRIWNPPLRVDLKGCGRQDAAPTTVILR